MSPSMITPKNTFSFVRFYNRHYPTSPQFWPISASTSKGILRSDIQLDIMSFILSESSWFDILKQSRVPIYVSAISCEIRGVTDQDLKDTNSRKVLPKTLLNLSLEADRTFVY